MTAGEILQRVDDLRPNAYSQEQKLRWLQRLDGQILLELLETHEGTDCCSTGGATGASAPVPSGAIRIPAALPLRYDLQTELLAPFPWGEGVYIAGLFCQIDLHNGEIQKYNQSLSLLASAWRSLADWINRGTRPKGARAWKM